MINNFTTIVARASASGQSGIGVIRISGSKTLEIAKKILNLTPKPRYAHYREFIDTTGAVIDYGLGIFFPNPRSYTGEDVLELQSHGSPIVLDQLINTALELGAVLAQPGEFSQRAVLNGKMDLLQAEAVADLIASSSRQGVQSALRSLNGEFSQKINQLVHKMTDLRVQVEAMIDFSDEDIKTDELSLIKKTITDIDKQMMMILRYANEGVILREGIHIAIIGKPNAGKSSLLNTLSKTDSAIVTSVAGTTRDIIKEQIQIKGIPIHILDTAGLHDSDDEIEKIGIQMTHKAIDQADCLLWVYDATDSVPNLLQLSSHIKNKPLLLVRNKIDLLAPSYELTHVQQYPQVSISNKTKFGISQLKEQVLMMIGHQDFGEHTLLARKRHIYALKKAQTYLTNAKQHNTVNSLDLLAEDLRLSANALGEITGQTSSDDLLGKIFSQFCVGK